MEAFYEAGNDFVVETTCQIDRILYGLTIPQFDASPRRGIAPVEQSLKPRRLAKQIKRSLCSLGGDLHQIRSSPAQLGTDGGRQAQESALHCIDRLSCWCVDRMHPDIMLIQFVPSVDELLVDDFWDWFTRLSNAAECPGYTLHDLLRRLFGSVKVYSQMVESDRL